MHTSIEIVHTHTKCTYYVHVEREKGREKVRERYCRIDGWMDGWMDEWMDGWMDGRTDGRTDGSMDGWMDGWMDGCGDRVQFTMFVRKRAFSFTQKEKRTDRQTYK